jgi:hypothetical protein
MTPVRSSLALLFSMVVFVGAGDASPLRSARSQAPVVATPERSQSAVSFDALWTRYPLPSVVGNIQTVLGYNSGVIVGGQITDYGTVHARNIAFWDGTWHAMGTSAPNIVYALALYGGQPVAAGNGGGTGNVVGAGEKPSIYQWNGADWIAIGSTNGQVNAITAVGSDLYVGGTFVSVNGVAASYVARWDGSSWHAVGSGFASGASVNELVVHGGNVVAAGRINEYFGIAQWTGAAWSTLGAGLKNGAQPATVTGLVSNGTTLYASGNITASGATPLGPVVAWNGSAWSVLTGGVSSAALGLTGTSLVANANPTPTGAPHVWSGSAWQLFNAATSANVSTNGYTNLGSDLYAGGSNAFGIVSPATVLGGFARFDGSSWTQLGQAWTPDMHGFDGSGYCELTYHGDLYVGGTAAFFGTGDHYLNSPGLARWDGANWNAIGAGGQHFDLAVWNDSLIASIDGSVKVWNGSTWRRLAHNQTTASTFDTFGNMLSVWQGQLYCVGPTTINFGSVLANGVVRWTGSDWVPVGGGIDDPSGYAGAVTAWGSNLVVGGVFASAGGVVVQNLTIWDGAAYHDVGGGVNGAVYALTDNGSDLLAGGVFTMAGSDSAHAATRWDGSQWHAMGTRARVINRFRIHSGRIYAAGGFLDDANNLVYGAALWTGTEWQLLTSGIDSPNANTLEFLGDDLYLAGLFGEINGQPSRNFARLANVSALGVPPTGQPASRLALAPAANPARGVVRFAITLPAAGHARLAIHDVAGREVARLLDGDHAAGTFTLAWSGPVAPGLYFATLESAGERRTARVVRLQ